jgi:hypothetical protein
MSKWRCLRSLRWISFPALTLGAMGLAFAGEVVSECPVVGGQPICQYRNGYMLRFDRMVDRVIRVYGPDGQFRLNLPIQLPDVPITWAYDVAIDSDGSFVAGAAGGDGDIRRGVSKSGLVMFDANGLQTAFIDTGKFWPNHIAIAPDHAIWVLGSQSRSKDDYNVVRKYSRTGELLGSYLPRSSFPAGLEPGGSSVPAPIMAAGGKIAIVAFSGMIGNLLELIELDGNGNVLGRMRSDKQRVQFYALTSDGAFYGGTNNFLLRFDVAKGVTTEVQAPSKEFCLTGADGVNLVYRTHTKDDLLETVTMAQPGG